MASRSVDPEQGGPRKPCVTSKVHEERKCLMNGRFVTVLVLVAALSMMLASVAFAQGGMNKKFFEAELKPLNHSGASGHADLTKNNGKLKVNIHSEGMAPELP